MEGMLNGFTLRELFEMLAVTNKTGILGVNSTGEADARVCFRDGTLYWAETSNSGDAGEESAGPAKERIEDAIMEIFEWETESFHFTGGETVKLGGETALQVETVLADVQKRQAEWAEIRKEIPSMRAKIGLVGKLEAESVTLTPNQWSIIALVGKAGSVEDLRAELKTSQLGLCRALYKMSKLGLIRCLGEIEEPVTPSVKSKEGKRAGGPKKYIRKSLLIEDDGDGVPAEWASYYKRLDSKHEALKATSAAAVTEH